MKNKDRDAIARLYTENFNDNPYSDDFDKVRRRQSIVDKQSGRFDNPYELGKSNLKQIIRDMETNSADLTDTISNLRSVIEFFTLALKQGEEMDVRDF